MTPNNGRDTRNARWMAGAKLHGLKILAAGIALLVLQACTTAMPEPKYPIYMQDKPAEAVQTPQQAGDEKPVAPSIAAQGSKGGVQTTDLAPPPPPPPPPPTSSSSSVAAEVAPPPVKDTRAAYVYVLQPHDTLYGVSRRFGVPVKTLYQINGLAPDASLRIGQKILLPDTAVDKGVEEHANGAGMVKLEAALAKPAATPAKPSTPASTTTTTTTTTPKPAVKPPVPAPGTTTTTTTTTVKPAVTPAVVPKPAVPATTTTTTTTTTVAPLSGFPSNTQLSQMGRGLFVWPVRGRILVPFGQLAPNVRNDGINIAADSGAEVKAASDGVVVYEGDQVKELGNTIYIKHANGWYTGYSHLLSMSVKNNERVTKGQVIGKVGQTGVIDRPQLHFEVRFTPSTDIARPIDPNLVLP